MTGLLTGLADVVCVRATLGINNPFVVLCISSMEDASGVKVPVPMPTDWAFDQVLKNTKMRISNIDFFIK